MSMLNHMAVFRAAMPAPGLSGNERRNHRREQARRRAPATADPRYVGRPDKVLRIYAMVAVGTFVCAITAGVVAVTSIT